MSRLWLLCAAVGCFSLIGCAKTNSSVVPAPPGLVVKVTIPLPGASPEAVDSIIAKFFLLEKEEVPHVQAITCVSSFGRFEAYVLAETGTDIIGLQDQLVAKGPSSRFLADAGAGEPGIRFMRGGLPTITPKEQPQLSVLLNPEKLAALGLTPADLHVALAEASRDFSGGLKSADDVRTDIVAYIKGEPVRLGDVATVQAGEAPDCIVRTKSPK